MTAYPHDTRENISSHHDSVTSLIRNEEIPVRRNGQHFESPEQKAAIQALFLAEFAQQANVSAACASSGISRETAYRWLREDDNFAAGWAESEQRANDVLRNEAFRRAVTGVDEPIISLGKVVRDESTGAMLTVQKYDTPLLMMLMRARMPEYRDSRQVTVDSNIQVNTSHQLTIDTRGMSQDDLQAIRAIAQRMKDQEQARIEKTGKDSISE